MNEHGATAREKRGVLDFINNQSGVLLRSAFGIAIQFILTIPLDSGLNPSGKPVEQG
jgi:hypothetical protein